MWEFISERWDLIAYNALQHANLVLQAVVVATVVAVGIAVVVDRFRFLDPVANTVSAIGLTIPSFALVGLLLPILRNAVVGFAQVDKTLIESARGLGMSETGVLLRVRLPLAWPVIHAGVRTSVQMSMGIAAIAAYVLGPGLGGYIFTGLSQAGGVNAVNYAVVGTVGIVLVALVADLLMLLLGRVTISKGIRA